MREVARRIIRFLTGGRAPRESEEGEQQEHSSHSQGYLRRRHRATADATAQVDLMEGVSDKKGMSVMLVLPPETPAREAPHAEPCAFDSLTVEQLKCELAAERVIVKALRARLEVTARLLQAERSGSE